VRDGEQAHRGRFASKSVRPARLAGGGASGGGREAGSAVDVPGGGGEE
jgi:hypothetical protein